MALFKWGQFKSASGRILDWKIECDGLTSEDWDCIARAVLPELVPFGKAYGVPTGGLLLAAAFAPHAKDGHAGVLICDDVWTTGQSVREFVRTLGLDHKGYTPGTYWHGVVAFARGPLPTNVVAFATII